MLNKEYLNELKHNFSVEEIYTLMEHLGCEPTQKDDSTIVGLTCCHNGPHQGSHKLYYYANQGEGGLFRCYTGCEDPSFDVFDLVRRIKTIEENNEWDYFRAAYYILNFFNISVPEPQNFGDPLETLADWKLLNKYRQSVKQREKKIVEFNTFDSAFLQNFPRPIIQPWIEEGISADIMKERGICYDPVNQGIVIPHYDENGALIGVRERTLIKEEEEFGKYRPAIVNGKMFNHALGFCLYNLNFSKNNIKTMQKAIVVEGEKSALKMASYFGADKDISVAVCGSNLTGHQVKLLLKYNVNEIILALDREYVKFGDEEFDAYAKKLEAINQKYSNLCKFSFMIDKRDRIGYKSSPLDHGPDIFLELFKERISL